jgi:hypothetical protein
MGDELPICVRCGRPVERNRGYYETFERMHWSCFHYEFEHEGDPDIACPDPSCPARRFDPEPQPDFLSDLQDEDDGEEEAYGSVPRTSSSVWISLAAAAVGGYVYRWWRSSKP